jgi:CBS domain-containing protein
MMVRDAMTRDVHIVSPDETIRHAAQTMAEIDAGVLPVGENDRLIGMITDRDVAVRAVAAGKSPDTRVRDVMPADLCYCFEDEGVDDIAEHMRANDMARADGHAVATGEALNGICEPGGIHSQSASGQGAAAGGGY